MINIAEENEYLTEFERTVRYTKKVLAQYSGITKLWLQYVPVMCGLRIRLSADPKSAD
jgi:hypothetical protein